MKRALALLAALAAVPAQSDATLPLARAFLAAQTPAGHDADAQALELVATASRHASHVLATLPLAAVETLIDDVRDPLAIAAAIAPMAEDASAHGLARVMAMRVRATALLRGRRTDAAFAVRRTNGFVDEVLVFGPFGDDGDHYLGVAFPPEFGLDAAAPAAGRFGPVTPRVATRRLDHPESAIRLRDPRTQHEGCFYALYQVVSEAPRAGYLEVVSPGSFEVFVNGTAMGRVDAYAAAEHAWHWVPIRLRQGHNHVLVKTALNGFDDLGLRCVDGAGRPLALRPAPAATITPCAPAAAAEPELPGPFLTPLLALAQAARRAPADAARTLHLAASLLASLQRQNAEALEHLVALESLGAPDAEQALALAAAWERAEALPEEVRRSRSRAVFDPLWPSLEGHAWATRQRAQHLADADKVEDAIRLLQPAVVAKVAGAPTLALLLQWYGRLEFAAEATRLRATWHATFPGDARAALAIARERERAGDHRGALAVLQATLARTGGDRELTRRGMLLAAQLGDADAARTLHAELHAADPQAPAALIDRAEIAERGGDQSGAVAAWQALAAHADASAAQLVRAGRELVTLGADGAPALAAALRLDPSQHEARRLALRLAGATDAYAAFAEFRHDTDALVRAFVAGEREKEAPSTLVLDQMIVEVLQDGSSVQQVHQIRRLNDLAGVEAHQDADDAARAKDLVALRTIGTDGKSYYPNRVERSFAMPRLEPGAFVEEIWRRFERAPGADPWRGPSFHFQSTDEPYVLSELVVIAPAGGDLSFRTRNFPAPAEVRTLPDGRQAHVYARRDTPRLTPEKLAPPVEEIVPVVTFGQDRRPGARARQARDYLAFRSRTSPLVDARARALTAGLEGDTAKAQAIHRFVHDEIPTGGGAFDPTAVLLRKQGARFYLQIALLRAAGVPLRPAVVASQADALDRRAPPLFSGDEQHERDAALLEPRDGPALWVFADAPRHWPLGQIPADRLGAAALLLDSGSWTGVRLPGGDPAAGEGIEIRGALTLDAKGNARCEVELRFRGTDGFAAADQLRDRDDNIRKLAARQVASQIFPGWRPEEVRLELDDHAQPLRARGVLGKARAVSSAGEASLLDLPVAKGTWLARYGDRAERTQPLLLTSQVAAAFDMTVDAGPALRFAELPGDVHVEHPLLDYSLTFARVGDQVRVRRTYLQRPGRLPAAQFGEWLRLLRQLDIAEDAKLRLLPR